MMDKFWFNNQRKLGLLGGGQLGRMLIQKATDLNIQTAVLDPDINSPCAFLAHEFHKGPFSEFDAVYNFGKQVDLLTVEIEHVNTDALLKLEKEGIAVYPQASILKMVQDKGLQKTFYRLNDIPTSSFTLIESPEEIKTCGLAFPMFQKLRKSGYDGRGVQKLRSEDDIGNAFEGPSVLEEAVNFQKEISVIVARNVRGEIMHFPPVDMEFNSEVNLVEFISSPSNISADIYHRSTAIAVKIIEKLQMTGVLAVEMFLKEDGTILVNEIAPRPHNSGHHTIEGNVTSQYEQHLRAILDLPLGSTDIVLPAVTVNILGAENFEGAAIYEGLDKVLKIEGAHVHLYGKAITKPFRKMGHVTVTDENPEFARSKANYVRENLRVIA